MAVFDHPEYDGHEKLVWFNPPGTRLRGIIAIHTRFFNRFLGRRTSLGGTRVWAYRDDDEAERDALRLSKGMTYKAALAGVPFGGAKAVIIADPDAEKPQFWLSYAEVVDSLNGRFITAEDMNVHVEQINIMRRETRWVCGASVGGSGDPSPMTAWGVFNAITTSARHVFGSSSLAGKRAAVQGMCGGVGRRVTERLLRAGAYVVGSEIKFRSENSAERESAECILGELTAINPVRLEVLRDPWDIYGQEADFFVPCAGGAVLNETTISLLRCRIVAGSANNQLDTPYDGERLFERGILYAPDYVVNAGGLIQVSYEWTRGGANQDRAFDHTTRIADTLHAILVRSASERVSPHIVADQMAREVIAERVKEAETAIQERRARRKKHAHK